MAPYPNLPIDPTMDHSQETERRLGAGKQPVKFQEDELSEPTMKERLGHQAGVVIHYESDDMAKMVSDQLNLLQSKHSIIHQVDAALQKHEDAFRAYRQTWMSTIDALMLQAGKGSDGLTDASSKHTADETSVRIAFTQRGEGQARLDEVAPVSRQVTIQAAPREASELPNGSLHAKSFAFSTEATGDEAVTPSSKPSAPERIDSKRRQVAQSVSARKQLEQVLKTASSLVGSSWKGKGRTWSQRLVNSKSFEIIVFLIILMNVVFVGYEVDYMANHPGHDKPDVFAFANYIFSSIFVLEIALRLFAAGLSFLSPCHCRDWAWNLFDVFVVMSSVAETIAAVIQTSSNSPDMAHFRVIRIIRITKMMRAIRMVRMVRFVRALRTLIHSIMVTLRAAVWSLLLLLIIFYGFGVAFTQAVSDYCGTMDRDPDRASSITFPELQVRAAGCGNATLIIFFGTLPRSMFTMFKCIAGGVSWHEVVEPLAAAGAVWVALFVVFITFTLFAVLNVVTGLFCQSAIESAQQDKDIATMQLMANKSFYLRNLDELFEDLDANNTGFITIVEFESALKNGRCQAFFESLEIECKDAWELFKLLDADESGSIEKDEFFMGCLQLRGHASAVDIAKMAYDNKVFFNVLEDFMSNIEEHMLELMKVIAQAVSESGVVDSGKFAELFSSAAVRLSSSSRGVEPISISTRPTFGHAPFSRSWRARRSSHQQRLKSVATQVSRQS